MRASTFALTALLGLLLCTGTAGAFTVQLVDEDFPGGVSPSFSGVSNFFFEIDFAGPPIAGATYDNSTVREVRYLVNGSLAPGTPSGFPAFRLDRTAAGEGVIDPANWIAQGSSIFFEIASDADLADGLQLSDLVADATGEVFRLDAREFERLDRARYHPPQLVLRNDGTGQLQNSNNSSGSTGTTNPATRVPVDVDFGDEYVTGLSYVPSQVTMAVPEPGTGLLVGFGLAAMARRRRRPSAS